ncbi:MAG TPA: NAD(+)/NADH kinase [Candidatus Angelobacter sp.]|jgi:NAD+ kinase|nr:NAD(+)/NADH kinase [Candidatus Angelobacter sp.]
MKVAAIISKKGSPELGRVVPELTSWLGRHGYAITVDTVTSEFAKDAEVVDAKDLAVKRPNFVIVLGGDGTLLSTARIAATADIPILGINLGSLGFLTEVKQDEIQKALESIDAGRSAVNSRAMLHCQLRRAGKCIANYEALNDVVISQSALARITDFDVHVDGIFVSNYKADGLIVSTPTGSTAYSLAAGGPVLSPDVPAFVITPVASHALTNRSLVVQDKAFIEIRMKVSREAAFLTIDGQPGTMLADGDIVECRKSAMQVKLLKLPERSFFDVLRTKLKWGERA